MSTKTLTRDSFFKELELLTRDNKWRVTSTQPMQPIRLSHADHPGVVFDPLTAVYYTLKTGSIEDRIIGCSFTLPEVTAVLGLPEQDIVDITFATDACTCGRRYDDSLRIWLLTALKLPLEKALEKHPVPSESLIAGAKDVTGLCLVAKSRGVQILLKYEAKPPTVTVHEIDPKAEVDDGITFKLEELERELTRGAYNFHNWATKLGLTPQAFFLLLRDNK